ncbi:FAD-binding oxidoreductase [Pseudomonas sp. MH9.2]|uniref:L-pipecolate oxidase n=1 Tax=unclassified Pseudomonas TaxID=196821 RepID=UPI002AC97E57|nr:MULTISPECIES: FAD-binding oxidoreductase [unclassified Pseudomonas]MEB0006758.1 FAD-binding oxidoreductase [Pseudomonas sp. RTB2]MEB0018223.1 FAD-binding oxidoreductase [Pseudomonas sp. RTB3]MEB0027118.1 FAD-binding oxidoreductase [Pseudomonas sp. MH9.2]MEB0148220.1 FAD-binding oxidoreductase [Pseudomonas sp. CCC2.2]MEB0269568.1 FAD-binding oxidoreductase [Pseudomonas sp. 5B4]
MALREECLWEKLTPQRPEAEALKGELTVDVCVIGAGITGLSAAIHLLEQGKRVAVLEAHRTGHGGSGRNVGLVNAGLWIPPDEIEAGFGKKVGSQLNQMLGAAPSLVFSLVDKYNIDCQLRREGTLHMAHNARGEADLRSREEQWKRRGAPVELLTGKACQDATGTQKISAALLDRRAGTFNPMAFTSGLAKAVGSLGGQLFDHSPVTRLERQGERWCVITEHGAVLAEKVVIASNAYTEGEWTELRRNFFPGYYYQVASAPLTEEAAQRILPGGQGSWDTRQVLSSIRRDADGRLLLGSLGNGNQKPAWFLKAWADRVQQHYFPYLKPVDWEFTWTGCIAFTPDHLLRLFEPAPGLVAVTGYNGRGNTTGSVVGKAFADYLCHGDTKVLPIPFAPMLPLSGVGLRSRLYEAGFSLYHAGQCLRIVI